MDRNNVFDMNDYRVLHRTRRHVSERGSRSAHSPPAENADAPVFTLDASADESDSAMIHTAASADAASAAPSTPVSTTSVPSAHATTLPTSPASISTFGDATVWSRHTLQAWLSQHPFSARIFFAFLAALLVGCFWFGYFLIHGNIPAVTQIFWKAWHPIFLLFPVSRLWDIPASFVWVYLLMYCFQKYLCAPHTRYLFIENVVLFFLVGVYVLRSFGFAPTFVAACACAVVIALNLRVLLRDHLGAELAWDLFFVILIAAAAGFGLGVGVAHVGLTLGFLSSLAILPAIALCAFTFIIIRECILLFY